MLGPELCNFKNFVDRIYIYISIYFISYFNFVYVYRILYILSYRYMYRTSISILNRICYIES